jgi:hypothetical protein
MNSPDTPTPIPTPKTAKPKRLANTFSREEIRFLQDVLISHNTRDTDSKLKSKIWSKFRRMLDKFDEVPSGG